MMCLYRKGSIPEKLYSDRLQDSPFGPRIWGGIGGGGGGGGRGTTACVRDVSRKNCGVGSEGALLPVSAMSQGRTVGLGQRGHYCLRPRCLKAGLWGWGRGGTTVCVRDV